MKAKAPDEKKFYTFRLFISGMTPKSTRAINNITELCEEYLEDRYKLEIIDIYQQPELAIKEQLIAAPTLIKELPLPIRKLVGDLSKKENVKIALNIKEK